jgi:hypothetical protein
LLIHQKAIWLRSIRLGLLNAEGTLKGVGATLEVSAMRAAFFLIVTVLIAGSAPLDAAAEQEEAVARQLAKTRRLLAVRAHAENVRPAAASFGGWWSGRLVFVRSQSTCSSGLSSFAFRHFVAVRGAAAGLSTSHDGAFPGRSRDGGRSYIFLKSAYTSSGPWALGVSYSNLSSSGRSAIVVYVAKHLRSNCTYAFGTYATR